MNHPQILGSFVNNLEKGVSQVMNIYDQSQQLKANLAMQEFQKAYNQKMIDIQSSDNYDDWDQEINDFIDDWGEEYKSKQIENDVFNTSIRQWYDAGYDPSSKEAMSQFGYPDNQYIDKALQQYKTNASIQVQNLKYQRGVRQFELDYDKSINLAMQTGGQEGASQISSATSCMIKAGQDVNKYTDSAASSMMAMCQTDIEKGSYNQASSLFNSPDSNLTAEQAAAKAVENFDFTAYTSAMKYVKNPEAENPEITDYANKFDAETVKQKAIKDIAGQLSAAQQDMWAKNRANMESIFSDQNLSKSVEEKRQIFMKARQTLEGQTVKDYAPGKYEEYTRRVQSILDDIENGGNGVTTNKEMLKLDPKLYIEQAKMELKKGNLHSVAQASEWIKQSIMDDISSGKTTYSADTPWSQVEFDNPTTLGYIEESLEKSLGPNYTQFKTDVDNMIDFIQKNYKGDVNLSTYTGELSEAIVNACLGTDWDNLTPDQLKQKQIEIIKEINTIYGDILTTSKSYKEQMNQLGIKKDNKTDITKITKFKKNARGSSLVDAITSLGNLSDVVSLTENGKVKLNVKVDGWDTGITNIDHESEQLIRKTLSANGVEITGEMVPHYEADKEHNDIKATRTYTYETENGSNMARLTSPDGKKLEVEIKDGNGNWIQVQDAKTAQKRNDQRAQQKANSQAEDERAAVVAYAKTHPSTVISITDGIGGTVEYTLQEFANMSASAQANILQQLQQSNPELYAQLIKK